MISLKRGSKSLFGNFHSLTCEYAVSKKKKKKSTLLVLDSKHKIELQREKLTAAVVLTGPHKVRPIGHEK